MTGVMRVNQVSYLIGFLSDNKSYKRKKIAIVLKEGSSYNSRFYDIVAKNCGICIKHFKLERDAIEWLA